MGGTVSHSLSRQQHRLVRFLVLIYGLPGLVVLFVGLETQLELPALQSGAVGWTPPVGSFGV